MLRNNIGTSFPAKVIIIFYEASNNKVRIAKVPSKVTIYYIYHIIVCLFVKFLNLPKYFPTNQLEC